jgi:hypothetical protein
MMKISKMQGSLAIMLAMAICITVMCIPASAQSNDCINASYFNYVHNHVLGTTVQGESEWHLAQVNDTGTAYITLWHPNTTNFTLGIYDSCTSGNICSIIEMGAVLKSCEITLIPGFYYIEVADITGEGTYYLDFDLVSGAGFSIDDIFIDGSHEFRPGEFVSLSIPIERIVDTDFDASIFFDVTDIHNTSMFSSSTLYHFQGKEKKVFGLNFTVSLPAQSGSYNVRVYISRASTSGSGSGALGAQSNGNSSYYDYSKNNAFEVINVLSGDVNNNNLVDIYDLASVGMAYGSLPGEAYWSSGADVNLDSIIDIFDLATVAVNFGNKI